MTRAVAAGESIDRDAVVFEMMFDAGEAAVVIAELAHLRRGLRGEIAEQQIGFLFVDTHIKAASGLRIKTLDRGIAINGIKLIGLNVAEQTLLRFLIGIVGGRQQIFALDFSFQEKRCARGGGAFAIAAFVGEMLKFLFEAVLLAARHQRSRIDVAQINHPFDDTGGDKRAQVRHEIKLRHTFGNARCRAHRRLPRFAR